MGWQDRDYHRDSGNTSQGISVPRFRGRSVVFWLIAINVAVFLLDKILLSAGLGGRPVFLTASGGSVALPTMGPLELWGYFSGYLGLQHGQVWRLITFQFLHANLSHILFNMVGLFFFGPMVEHYLGSRRFLWFYLFSGAVGSLFYILFWATGMIFSSPFVPLVGASAGVLGVVIGAAVIAPDTRIMLLFPPIPLRLRTLAWIVVGVGAFTVVFRGFQAGSNAGGEAAHLGGCLSGYLLIRHPHILNFFDRKGGSRGAVKTARPDRGVPDQAQVDQILDKVRDHGIASLTRKEKKTLKQATEAQGRGAGR